MNNYPLMVTPFEYISPRDRNKKQTEQYFQWFMTEKISRIEQLQNYINKTSTSKILLEKTPESLIPLWSWFEDRIEFVDKTDEEIEKMLTGKSKREQHLIKDCTSKMSLLTMALLEDISIYFAETLISNNSSIHWGYRRKPKILDGVNQPILLGFEGDLSVNQRTLVSVCIHRSARQRNDKELYETYIIWEKHALP